MIRVAARNKFCSRCGGPRNIETTTLRPDGYLCGECKYCAADKGFRFALKPLSLEKLEKKLRDYERYARCVTEEIASRGEKP